MHARVVLGGLLLFAACEFDTSGLGVPLADPPDAEPPIDAPEGCVAWPASNVAPCDQTLPMPAPLELAGGAFTYDTDTGMLTPPTGAATAPPSALRMLAGAGEVRVVVAERLSLAADARLALVGARPLIVIVHGDAAIDGAIDAAAHSAPRRVGAGGNFVGCGAGAGLPGGAGAAVGGGGGGAGAGFGADGDAGSPGFGTGRGQGGRRGVANGGAALTPLRGGCAGGTGGAGAALGTGGVRGIGGGAVEITARGRLIVRGSIAVGGSAGGGGAQRGGGGGGGAGGAILLEADQLELDPGAAVCANGAAGGEGGETATAGGAGEDATCSETVRARGGDGGLAGGNGGAGGNDATRVGDPGTAARVGPAAAGTGGGGGGGGVGRIRLRGRSARTVPDAATVSPAAEP